jgi:hypothetical protein
MLGSGGIVNAVSRSVAQRLHRREHIRQRVNMAIGAMNSLFFGRDVPFVEPFSSIAELPKGFIFWASTPVSKPPRSLSCASGITMRV